MVDLNDQESCWALVTSRSGVRGRQQPQAQLSAQQEDPLTHRAQNTVMLGDYVLNECINTLVEGVPTAVWAHTQGI